MTRTLAEFEIELKRLQDRLDVACRAYAQADDECRALNRAASDLADEMRMATAREAKINELVNKFLGWPVPTTEAADLCATDGNYPHPRYGTSFLSASGAKAMLEFVLQDVDVIPR